MPQAQKPQRGNDTKHWPLRIRGILYGLLVIPSFLLTGVGLLAGGAPGSEYSPLTIVFVYATFALPVVLLISCVVCIAFSFREAPSRFAFLFTYAPIANIAILIIAAILIQAVCGGSFICQP